MFLFRHLPASHAKRAEKRIRELGSSAMAVELVSLDSLDYEVMPNVEGVAPISTERLHQVREMVLAIQRSALAEPTKLSQQQFFDRELTAASHSIFPMPRFDAASDAVWRYLAFRVVPDVMFWRWPLDAEAKGGRANDRYHSHSRDRHGLGRLWWRHELFGSEATRLSENELIRLQERTYSISSRPGVARRLAELVNAPDVRHAIPGAKDAFLDELVMELRYRFALVPVDLMSEDEQRELIETVYPLVLERF